MGKHVPTVRTRRLTGELRKLREKSGMSWDEVAEEMGWSASKVYRIEADKVRVLVRDVKRLLPLYGVEGEEGEALIELAKQASEKGWWHQYSSAIPEWFQFYVGLESGASAIREYQEALVPGLLQTEAYMRAILSTAPVTDSDDGIDRQVAVRLARQDRVTTEDDPLHLWVVLDEAVIRRLVGGKAVMREQIEHLVEVGQRRNVTLQLLPFAQGEHASMLGAFKVLEFPDPQDPDVVYVEEQTGSLYVEKAEEVRRYNLIFDHLREKAISNTESLTVLTQAAKDLS